LFDDADTQLDTAAAQECWQAPLANVLSRCTLVQADALDEAIRGTDQRNPHVGRNASSQAQRATDARVPAARDYDSMLAHGLLPLNRQTTLSAQL
jgi:hypothetical protein